MSEKFVLILTADQRDLLLEALSLRMQTETATPVAVVEGTDLTELQNRYGALSAYGMRFAIDGGLKVSVEAGMWSLPYGSTEEPEPMRVVQAGALKRGLENLKAEDGPMSMLLTETVK